MPSPFKIPDRYKEAYNYLATLSDSEYDKLLTALSETRIQSTRANGQITADVDLALRSQYSAVRARYTLYQPDEIGIFIEHNPLVLTMLYEAIPKIDAIIADNPPIQLMLLSDQETSPTLYARVLTRCTVDEALALSDRLDDLRWSDELKSASSLLTFDVGML